MQRNVLTHWFPIPVIEVLPALMWLCVHLTFGLEGSCTLLLSGHGRMGQGRPSLSLYLKSRKTHAHWRIWAGRTETAIVPGRADEGPHQGISCQSELGGVGGVGLWGNEQGSQQRQWQEDGWMRWLESAGPSLAICESSWENLVNPVLCPLACLPSCSLDYGATSHLIRFIPEPPCSAVRVRAAQSHCCLGQASAL